MEEKFIESELVIGLVSAVGTENQRVIDLLQEQLGLAGYAVQVIKVSKDVIPLLCPVPDFGKDHYRRISGHMKAGNHAREVSDNPAILALGSAGAIYAARTKNEKGDSEATPKTAYIIDSLKRPEEVTELRVIYPTGFVLIGIHADKAKRENRLTHDLGIRTELAADLMHRDGEETRVPYGQRVNRTFHLADFFVRVSDSEGELKCDLKRIVSLWFGDPFVTPTFDEHAMFMAFGAALRSADMSRQVGAVITKDSQILSTGANDCPKAGGGLYWPFRNPITHCIGDEPKGRDYLRDGGDSNRRVQLRIIDQIVKDGKDSDNGLDPEKLRAVLEGSPLRDLTEFGRVVHAEMEALLSCGRSGLSTVGTTLYCTTFPCHNCAKHIIAAGVERVVYVEPYPKSKALEFHDDSISPEAESDAEDSGKVRFNAFVGIGPRRFFDLFSMNLGSSYELIRKHEDGTKLSWHIEKSQLRVQMKPTSYLEHERVASRNFREVLAKTAKPPGDG